MLCSIVIPLYNKASFIEEAIQSVLQQTHQQFELIVVDDGSKDDGALKVQAIADHRIKLVQQANGGVSRARNTGIDLAQGELVFFLDADDWFHPSYLETVVTIAMQHPDDVFFATHYKRFKNNCEMGTFWDINGTPKLKYIDNIYTLMYTADWFCTNSVAVRRSALTQFKPYFLPGEQISEDLDLWFRLGEKYRLIYCPQQLSSYRLNVTSGLCDSYKPGPMLPAYARIEQRALSGLMPIHLRPAGLRLVAEEKISVARRMLIAGQRYDAFKHLLTAWRALGSKRWWVSLAMCLVAPPHLVERWETWRLQRSQ